MMILRKGEPCRQVEFSKVSLYIPYKENTDMHNFGSQASKKFVICGALLTSVSRYKSYTVHVHVLS